MSREIKVRVLTAEQNPVEGARVRIHVVTGEILGMEEGGWLEPETTDDDGYADFETSEDYPDSHELTIYVGDEEFGPFEFGEDGHFTVTIHGD